MIRASVTTPMIGDGLTIETRYRPRISDIPGVLASSDVTGANLPAAPNEVVYEASFSDDSFALVEADPEYFVNWSMAI
jgi:hypothetical protein